MFRFTIRDVLGLTVVVGLGVALWLNHRMLVKVAAENHRLRMAHAELIDRNERQAEILK